jgi:hypothetical protein
MPIIEEKASGSHKCPFNNFSACIGEVCMAWARHGRSHEYTETDNLVETPDGLRPDDSAAPRAPEGAGWVKDGAEFSKGYHRSSKQCLPKARAQRWVRDLPVTAGYCSRTDVNGGAW